MAEKNKNLSYNEIPNKQEDWGLDSRNGLRYSGESVQKYIKDELQGRIGALYYDESNERYLAFADNADKELYLADPTNNATLVLATWNAPANYTAEINVATPPANFIHEDTKGNYIEFTFDIKNRTGASTGDSIICTYVITNGGKKQEVVATYTAGTRVQFLVDGYLSQGTNNIVIKIQGQSTYAATQASVSYVISDLAVTSDFQFQNIVSGEASVPYHVEGSGTKYVEVYLDNVLMDESSYNDSKADATKTVPVSSPGKHNIQIRAYVVNNSTKFYTDVLYYDFSAVGGNDTLFLAAAVTKGLGESLSLGVEQYGELNFKWAVYSPKEQVVNVEFLMNDKLLSTATSTNGVVNDFIYVANEDGAKTLTVNYANSSLDFNVEVDKSDLNVKEATEGLITKLSAKGRSNNESNPAVWENNGVTTSFNGFAWNETQGWNNGQLVISKGASIEVNISPFDGDVTSTGKTIELEFQTASIIDGNGTICECVNPLTGAGIVITPTSAVLRSAGGSEVVERFKDNEKIKVCFIINRNSTVTDKQLMFIVTDGIHSRCASYGANDTFYGTDTLKFTSDAATIKLDTIRIYNRAITVDEELNNVMIDSDNLVGMYSKNDIYEEGTNKVSVEKVSAHIPVLIFTGDIETLLRASDKNTSVRCDIQFINNQNPKYSFRVVNAKVKLQGTSSLGYPRKNFRFYTDETDICKIYDYAGELIADGKFSFKEGAQPVTCWCLKADFAESSGSHNTGIAKLWNKVMKDVKLNDEYVCRTQAQKKALANNYEYDVRTTIDGYPIVCFYRQTATSELVFLGQYNFNNDKSTESVFGFCDIPGIDYSSPAEGNVQCWECLGNTNDLGLFKTVANFDSKWEEAFEARYPDLGGDAPTGDLKAFATWLVSTRQADDVNYSGNITIAGEVKADGDKQYASEQGYTANGSYADNEANRQLKFQREKWDHMDVYKMAAYYIYFMRFGAVDQLVKNSMLTTEGTQGAGTKCKWYYINYDNDTINGLVNNGRLLVAYDADRNTPSSLSAEEQDSAYEYAGRESTLWNNLEKDEEFMRIVRDLDNAMYSAGLTYKEIMRIFDEEQTDKWCERIYNSNGRYKYIQPYQESNTDYMFMLQGARKSHRHWWLSNRFEIYDSKWITGSFLSQYVEFKVDNGAATEFTITSGKKLNYGYGVNAIVLQSGIELNIDESHTFDISDDGYTKLAIGDPVRIYGAPSLKSFELRNYQSSLTDLNVSRAATGNTDCLLEGIYLGTESGTNSSLTAISGLNSIKSLKELDIRGFKALTELTLTDLTGLNKFLAANSGLTAFSPANGVNLSDVSLPDTLQVLSMNNASVSSFGYTPTATLRYLSLKNVEGINTLDFVKNWVSAINGSANADLLLKQATLEASGLDWTMTAAELIEIGKISNKNLTGKAYLTVTPTVDEITALVGYFGTNCFDKDAAFIIDAPEGVTFVGKTSFKSGNTETYSLIEFPVEGGAGYTLSLKNVTSTIEDGKVVYITDNVKFYPATGEMVTTESATEKSVTVRATNNISAITYFDMVVTVEARTYPESINITGPASIRVADQEYTYNAEYTPSKFDGTVSVEWYVGKLEPLCDEVELTWTTGVYINGSNTILSNVQYQYCDYIPVVAGEEMLISGVLGTGNGINFYNDQKQQIAFYTSQTLGIAADVQTIDFPFIVPGGATYMRFSTKIDAVNSIKRVLTYTVSPSANLTITNSGINSCILKASLVADEIQSETLVHTLTKPDGSVVTTTFDIAVTTQEIIMTKSSNPEVLAICHSQGWTASNSFMTAAEAAAVTSIGTVFKDSSITHFEEFVYFTGVTALDRQAIYGCKQLKVLKFPESITSFDYRSFAENPLLEEIVFPPNVTSTGGDFITGCTSLKRLVFNEGLKTILFAGYGTSQLTELNIPSSVTEVRWDHDMWSNVTDVTINKDYVIGGNQSPLAFSKKMKSLQRIHASGLSTYIESEGALYSSDGFTLVKVPSSFTNFKIKDGITTVGAYSFAWSLIETVSIPDSCLTIGSNAFRESNIYPIDFNHVTTIGDSAFNSCPNITSIDFKEVNSIGSYCFGNTNITGEVTIPETVSSLTNRVFENCKKITKVTIGTPIAKYNATDTPFLNCNGIEEVYFSDTCIGARDSNTQSAAYFYSRLRNARWTANSTVLFDSIFRNIHLDYLYNIDHVTLIKMYAFSQCIYTPKKIEFKSVNKVYNCAFTDSAFEQIFLSSPSLSHIGVNEGWWTNPDGQVFMNAKYLIVLALLAETPPTLTNTNSFTGTPIESGAGYIYVPDESVEAYKSATNWNVYANSIKPISSMKDIKLKVVDMFTGLFLDVRVLYGFNYEYENGVIFSIINGNEHATIDQNGKITINETANASVITVRATSIYDESKYDEKDITITYSDGILYSLPSATAFNNSNYIDTGVQLMSEDIDWTIYVRGVVNAYQSQDIVFHCIHESSPYPGVALDCINSNSLRLVYMTNKTMNLNYTYGKEFELKLTHVAGSFALYYSFTTNGNTISGEKTDYIFTSVTQNLLIGAYQTTAGETGRYLNGTISEFYIKNYVE